MAAFPIYGGEIALFFLFIPSAACSEQEDICARLYRGSVPDWQHGMSFFTITILSVSQTVQGMSNVCYDILPLLLAAYLCVSYTPAPSMHCLTFISRMITCPELGRKKSLHFAQTSQVFCSWSVDQRCYQFYLFLCTCSGETALTVLGMLIRKDIGCK